MPALDPTNFSVAAGTIHLWQIDLRLSEPAFTTLLTTLSPAELTRANQFVFPEDRAKFIVAHGALRAIVGRYLGRPPALVSFATNAFGKPRPAATEHMWLHFNLSHSGDHALVACARGCEVGIDLEQHHELDYRQVADEFFSPNEKQRWLQLPERDRAHGFFRLWVHKEAYVKALGKGLSHPSQGYTVHLPSMAHARLAEDLGRTTYLPECEFRSLDVPPDYAGALAVLGSIRTLTVHRFGGEFGLSFEASANTPAHAVSRRSLRQIPTFTK